MITTIVSPTMMENETLFLTRPDVKANAKSLNSIFDKQVTLFITNLRMFCVGDNQSFDIPLFTTKNIKFNQPIFGCNYLSGTTTALDNVDDYFEWKLYFNNGTGTFLHIFYWCLTNIQSNVSQTQSPFQYEQQAFVDPSDPSILYITT